MIIPKSSRGKEKKFNYTNISAPKATGIIFSASVGYDTDQASSISVHNSKTYYQLPLTGFEHLTTKDDIIQWLQQFPAQLPANYATKLTKLTNRQSLRYKAVPGDSFRFEMDFFTDGYVLVIGDLRQMQKEQLFVADSI
ncbi:hypothetical protein MHB44_10560 [Lysinibacillus sp. FSL H8-0500]|uniref:hypothetical protein n=1 Tax=Lysinibacillus sp. FSL H8-0500 TaxID=2921393 RepID=UPI003101AD56